jgi:hypothetical protein
MASLKELTRDFERLAKRSRLAHAYLFFGESRTAGADLVKMLANLLEHGDSGSQGILIDASTLDGESVGIEEARRVAFYLSEPPVASPRKTLAILRADRLTLPAQHALLKIVEEPPPYALILFTVRNASSLLPALVSRFQKIFIAGSAELPAGELRDRAGDLYRSVRSAATARERGELLKQVTEDPNLTEAFVTVAIDSLRENRKDAAALRELLRRWTAMQEFNVNKKLQLESVFAILDHS